MRNFSLHLMRIATSIFCHIALHSAAIRINKIYSYLVSSRFDNSTLTTDNSNSKNIYTPFPINICDAIYTVTSLFSYDSSLPKRQKKTKILNNNMD